MRIAAVSNSRIPSRTANSIEAMKACQALTDLGHDVKILVPKEVMDPNVSKLMDHYGLHNKPVIEWLSSRSLLKRFDFIYHAHSQAKKYGADLIYTWLPQSAVIAVRAGYPTVLEMHADVGGRFGRWWLRRFFRSSGKKRMTVTTRALRATLERSTGFIFLETEAIVAPNGVDLAEYKNLPTASEARRRLNLDDRLTAGFTGHIYPGRGAELLFELASRFPEINFLWVGGNPETIQPWQKKAAAAGLKNVILTGFVEHSRVPLYQAAAEILLMPYGKSVAASSGQEISGVINPMKMFEYMAAGRAILSADLPSIREILNEESAVFCKPDDLEGWTNTLRSLLNDERRRLALGTRAQHDAEKYSWRSRAERILEGLL